MEPGPVLQQNIPMMEPNQSHSIQYFLASLAGIARALQDFGYRDEAGQLFRVKEELEIKVTSLKKE
jgi:hypothetical protein